MNALVGCSEVDPGRGGQAVFQIMAKDTVRVSCDTRIQTVRIIKGSSRERTVQGMA